MSIFTEDTKVEEPAEWAEARSQLLNIGSSAPTFGVQGTAGMTDTEQAAQGTLSQYASGRSPEVQAALDSYNEASNYTSLTDIPEYAALLDVGNQNVNDQLNRMGRSLQLSGNTSSGSGAQVMADEVGNLNSQLLSSLAPYAAQERDRSYNAAGDAANLATSDTQNRLAAVQQYGALPRELEQISLNAEYMSNYLNQTAPYQYQVPTLSAVGNIGDTVLTGGGLTDYGFYMQAASGAASTAASGS